MCYTIKLMFQEELILINQMNQKNAWFVISMMAYELENSAILNVKGVNYRCILWNLTKNDAIIG